MTAGREGRPGLPGRRLVSAEKRGNASRVTGRLDAGERVDQRRRSAGHENIDRSGMIEERLMADEPIRHRVRMQCSKRADQHVVKVDNGFAIGGLLGVLSRARDSRAPSVAAAPVVPAPAVSTGRPVRVAASRAAREVRCVRRPLTCAECSRADPRARRRRPLWRCLDETLRARRRSPGRGRGFVRSPLARACQTAIRSKRSAFITLVHAVTKSLTNFSLASLQA